MASDRSSDTDSRVVMFPRGRRFGRLRTPSPVNDLSRFEARGGTDDYRHRMAVNFGAFLFVLVLIGTGLWIADTMAEIRKNEDCMFSGRHNCTPLEVTTRRW